MRKLIAFALVAFAGLWSASLASAQARQVQGQIPFNFTAGSLQLPAGQYRLAYDISGLVTLRDVEKGNTVAMLVAPDEAVKDGTCKLIFVRHGDQYFLKQSACRAANVNFSVPASAIEKKAQERAASNHDGAQTVIAMK